MTLHRTTLENKETLQDSGFGFNDSRDKESTSGETQESLNRQYWGCWSDGVSFCRVGVLAVILSRLHLEDVGNDAVDRHVTY